MRDRVKHRTDINIGSIRECWHKVRCRYDNESWYEYALLEFDSLDDAMQWCYDAMDATKSYLPYYDCSGMAFICGFTCNPTHIPHVYAVVLHWTIDV